MSEQIVIVGAGHAAGQVVASLRQKKFAGNIVLVGDEAYLPYQRPPLSKKFLAGELPADRLYFKPPAFYDDPAINVRLNTRVDAIDRSAKTIATSDGETLAYEHPDPGDGLTCAHARRTGHRSRRCALPAVNRRRRCHSRRSLERQQSGHRWRRLHWPGGCSRCPPARS